MILPRVRVGVAMVLVLNTSFGGSEDFNKTGLDGALYSLKGRDCLIASGKFLMVKNSILLKAAH
jgi:hypothetical protein